MMIIVLDLCKARAILHAFFLNLFTYIVIYKRERGLILNQYSSHLHEDLQQLDTAAQERRHGFVSHPDILHTNTHGLTVLVFSLMQLLQYFKSEIIVMRNK